MNSGVVYWTVNLRVFFSRDGILLNAGVFYLTANLREFLPENDLKICVICAHLWVNGLFTSISPNSSLNHYHLKGALFA